MSTSRAGTAEVVCIGDELLSGHVRDTNAAWLAVHLAEVGVRLLRTAVVGDDLDEICEVIDAAAGRVPLVIVTGGLGPTSDDITRAALARLLGGGLERDPALVDALQAVARDRGRELLPESLRMADVPVGATPLQNPAGSAPALRLTLHGSEVFALPGVPSEAQATARRHVLAGRAGGRLLTRSLFVTLVPESAVAAELRGVESGLPVGVRLAYLPSATAIEVRLSATGADEASAAAVLDPLAQRVRTALSAFDAVDDAELAPSLIGLLATRGQTVAVAESLTGGAVTSALVDVAGASAVVRGAVVAYATELKAELLGVPVELLAERGPVDADVAVAMARGVRERCASTWGLATTGVAGPAPQDGHDVGEVHIGVCGPSGTHHVRVTLAGDRARIRAACVATALLELRRALTRSGE